MKKSTWKPIANLVFIVAVGWGGYQVSEIGKNKTDKQQQQIDYCQLSTQVCEQNNASVTLATDVINPMQNTEINVQWPDLPAETDHLVLTLEGHEMMMGVYQLQLSRTASGGFSGDLTLPFCTSDEMTWQGNIKPSSDQEKITPINVSIRMVK